MRSIATNPASWRRFAAAVVLLFAFKIACNAQPSIAAARISSEIHLDGRLDEDAWRTAPVLTLTQQSPRPGQANPYSTEVRILVSSDALYFGFACHDPLAGRIAVHTMQRDGNVTGDDT